MDFLLVLQGPDGAVTGAAHRGVVIEQILGHTSRSMTARHARGGVPLPLLAEAMERRRWGWVPAAVSLRRGRKGLEEAV